MALDALEDLSGPLTQYFVVLLRQLSLCGPCSSAAGDVQSYNKMLFYPFLKFDGYRSSGGMLVIRRKSETVSSVSH